MAEIDPKCPLCGRSLENPIVWEVPALDNTSHTEARGTCEFHGVMYIRSTPSGGWLEVRQ